MNIFYASINNILDSQLEFYLSYLPLPMQSYVHKFAVNEDKKHRLLARLMLRHCLIQTTGNDALLHTWELDDNRKPFIRNWFEFSIAHSGEFVVFGYHDSPIGIDIEKAEPTNYLSVIEYLHPEEQYFIEESARKDAAFYAVWVKKEAVLKAIGIGIVNGIGEFSCTKDFVIHNDRAWGFHSIHISRSYACYACAQKPATCLVEEFSLLLVK